MLVYYMTYNERTKKTSGWYQCDKADFQKLMKYRKEFEMIDVLVDNDHWRWSRLKGWRKLS